MEEAASAPEGSEERKFGDLYASFMDEDRAEPLGSRPSARRSRRLGPSAPFRSCWRRSGGFERTGNRGPVPALRRQRPGQPGALPGVPRAGAHLAARRELLPRGAVRRHPRRVRWSSAANVRARRLAGRRPRRQRVFALETAIAGHHWDNVANRDSQKTYNLLPWAGVLSAGAGPARLAGGPRRARRRLRRGRGPPAELPHRAGLAAHREHASGVAGLAALAGHPQRRRVPDRGVRRGELRLLRPHPHAAPPSCGSAGSAVSRWSRARWARRSAGSTSSGTSRRGPRSGWMSSSPTCSRPTARASASSSG